MKISLWTALPFLVTMSAPLAHAQFTSTSCTLNPNNHTVTICTPQSRTSSDAIASPVRVVAACTDSTPINVIQIYDNGQKVVQRQGTREIDIALPLKAGSNTIAVACKDTSGVSFSGSVNTSVSTACTAGSGNLAVCEPTAGESQDSPVHFVARDFDPAGVVSGMQIEYANFGTVLFKTCGRSLDAWIKVPAGTNSFTVVALDSCVASSPDRIDAATVGPVTVR